MRAEDSAVGVQLVDDDVFEILEIVGPFRVVGEDAGVQHVGVRDDDVSLGAREAALHRLRVAVVDEAVDFAVRERRKLAELRELVLSERLRREQIKRARRRILQNRVQHRQVVAERLARGRRRRDYAVLARERAGDRLALMRIERLDAAALQRVDYPLVELAERAESRGPRRKTLHRWPPPSELRHIAHDVLNVRLLL